jgi:hypothetical protein
MAFTGVPMMIGGGEALHSADLMRHLVSNFFYGVEGVIRAGDCQIKAQPAPDGSVRMVPGGVAVENRSLGGSRQAYFDYNDQDERIPIEATGSAGGRSDLIIARVEDPYAAGTQWQYPVDRKRGPYIFPRVIPNVDRRIFNVHQLDLGYSAITLARVDVPANTTAITQNMIVDLRSMANGPQRYQEPDPPVIPPPPQVDSWLWTESRIHASGHEPLNHTDRTFKNWPTSASWRVPIPAGACGVDIFAVVQNPKQMDGHVWGEMRGGFDAEGSSAAFFGTGMPFDMDAIPGASGAGGWMPNRIPHFYSTTLQWGADPAYQGRIRTFRLQAKQYNDINTRGKVIADNGTVTYVSLNFKRFPIIN